MSNRAHRLIEEFFSLPESEQAEVLEAIVPTDALDPALRAELERRVQGLRDGTMSTHAWADVERELSEIIGGSSGALP